MAELHINTQLVHAGYKPDPTTGALAVPRYVSAAYALGTAENAAAIFALQKDGYTYSRIGDPTTTALEDKLTVIEGGVGAVAFSSGTQAVLCSILNLAENGDEIVAANDLYGGTFTQHNDILSRLGITVKFVDPTDLDELRGAITDRTKAVYTETMGNPGLNVPDLEAIAAIAHENGIPYIVDSTFTPPVLLRPFDYGADIVVHSLTKWMNGHGTVLGGAVIDSGNFDWAKSGKHPLLTEKDSSYHGLNYAYDLLGGTGYIVRMALVPLRNLGGNISPHNSGDIMQGSQTLHLRMERTCENALAVAEYLEAHDLVDWVQYPGLESHPSHENAVKYLPNGFGGVVVFGPKGGKEAGRKFINSLEGQQVITHAVNVGDARTLIVQPGTTTHSQHTPEQLEAAGIAPELLRLSLGIEYIDDIIGVLGEALHQSQQK